MVLGSRQPIIPHWASCVQSWGGCGSQDSFHLQAASTGLLAGWDTSTLSLAVVLVAKTQVPELLCPVKQL